MANPSTFRFRRIWAPFSCNCSGPISMWPSARWCISSTASSIRSSAYAASSGLPFLVTLA